MRARTWKTWVRLIGEAQLVHVEQGGAQLEQMRVDVRPVRPKYLRIVGESAGPMLTSVSALREDTIAPRPSRLNLAVNGTKTSTTGEFLFALGAHIPVEATVHLMLPPNTVVPVSLSSAVYLTEKPSFLVSTTFYRMVKDGAVIESPPVEICAVRVACCVYAVNFSSKAPALEGPMQIVGELAPASRSSSRRAAMGRIRSRSEIAMRRERR